VGVPVLVFAELVGVVVLGLGLVTHFEGFGVDTHCFGLVLRLSAILLNSILPISLQILRSGLLGFVLLRTLIAFVFPVVFGLVLRVRLGIGVIGFGLVLSGGGLID
jgi:hypothetical protein